MKISVDGGGLGAKKGERFGNYVFSENLIRALSLYDKKNEYFVYTFTNLKPRLAWLKGRVSLEELINKKDVFLALNQAIPLLVSEKVISFCHGLSYYFYPEYYSKKDYSRLMNQLKEMIKRSNYIVVSSEKVKKELEELTIINYSVGKKVVAIPFGIPFDMLNKRLLRHYVPRNDSKPYFLYVGMDHSIKNIEFIRKTFRKFRELGEFKSYRLILVTKNCARKKLCHLYRNATALLTASYYESFNLPVLEALSQGCPVIGLKSAIIPELAKYVNVASDDKEFVKLMEMIPKKPNIQLIKLPAGRQDRLDKEFNWRNYVNELVRLYEL